MTPEEQQSLAIRARLQRIAKYLKAELPGNTAFMLLATPPKAGGRVEYVANVERFDALQIMRNFIVVNNVKYGEHVDPEYRQKAFDAFWEQMKTRVEYLSPEIIAHDAWDAAEFEAERKNDLTTYTNSELKDLALSIMGELDRRDTEANEPTE